MIKFLHKLEEVVVVALLAAMTLLVIFEVFLRFFLNSGVLWAQELTLHLSAWLVLFGAPYGIRVSKHIGVDALVNTFPPGGQRLATAVAILCGLAFCGLMLYGSVLYAQKMHLISLELEDMPIQRWVAHGVPLVAGFGLLAWRLCYLLYQVARGKAFGFGNYDEAKDSMHLIEAAKKAQEAQAAGGAK
jgi:C4-dicarboxylate transporter DctQ subunit